MLAKGGDGRYGLSDHAGGGVDELEGIELMIVDAGDVNFAGVYEGYPGVNAQDTSVCSSIYQGSTLAALDVAVVDVISCSRRA